MSNKAYALSSEKALDEYFAALLDEEFDSAPLSDTGEELDRALSLVEKEAKVPQEETVELVDSAEHLTETSVELDSADDVAKMTLQPEVSTSLETNEVEELEAEPEVIDENSFINNNLDLDDTRLDADTDNISVEDYSANSQQANLAQESEPELEIIPELEPKLQISSQTTYTDLKYGEFEVPDLDDVQKLLDRLETTDLAGEPEIVTLIEQNTQNISSTATQEIQEWDIEEDTSLTEASDAVETAEVVQAAEPEVEVSVAEPEVNVEEEVHSQAETEAEVELQTQAQPSGDDEWHSTARSEDFQVLYFDVNGVTFAVPLDELGGIHQKAELSHLIGRPQWYLGLQSSRENQLDVVDTAKWVMADRLADDSYKDEYKYVVMLGASNWGLASTELKGTEILNADKVRWREQAGKRPWLAGMVKEKMCALIHVEAMIKMLSAGLDVKSLDS